MMKQGSTDDPFADADEEEEEEGEPESVTEEETEPEGESVGAQQSSKETVEETATTPEPRRSLPYIHSRNGVKDGRTQRPVFLRDHIEEGIDELVDQMESGIGESVYKTDVTEAAMAVAQEHPELVLAKLEEWGYGWD